jgi:hypothetical protein
MKYFFLTEGWTIGRVWGTTGGLWQADWRQQPVIERLNFALDEPDERLWLYQVEAAVLMVEVVAPIGAPASALGPDDPNPTILHVVLKRLMTAEQTIGFLADRASV